MGSRAVTEFSGVPAQNPYWAIFNLVESVIGGEMDVEALRERHVFKREMGATVQKPEATPPANPTTTDSANLVCCASCRHFQADEVGDGSGIGKCTVSGEGGTTDTPRRGRGQGGDVNFRRREMTHPKT
jgi:hypothetical protein